MTRTGASPGGHPGYGGGRDSSRPPSTTSTPTWFGARSPTHAPLRRRRPSSRPVESRRPPSCAGSARRSTRRPRLPWPRRPWRWNEPTRRAEPSSPPTASSTGPGTRSRHCDRTARHCASTGATGTWPCWSPRRSTHARLTCCRRRQGASPTTSSATTGAGRPKSGTTPQTGWPSAECCATAPSPTRGRPCPSCRTTPRRPGGPPLRTARRLGARRPVAPARGGGTGHRARRCHPVPEPHGAGLRAWARPCVTRGREPSHPAHHGAPISASRATSAPRRAVQRLGIGLVWRLLVFGLDDYARP